MGAGPGSRRALAVITLTGALLAQGLLTGLDPSAARPRITATTRSLVRKQWPLRAIGVTKIPARTKLHKVIVATVDTGVDLNHPDLRHRLWRNPRRTPAPLSDRTVPVGAPGWNLLGDDPRPADHDGHGTVVGGLIAAQVGNGTGINGVAANARLMLLKACGTNPVTSEIVCADQTYAAAMEWAVAHGARVVHMSWSLGGGPEVSRVVAAHPEALFVTSAENGGGTNVDEGRIKHNCELPYPNLICVAGSTRARNPTQCTNVGPTSVDIAAPGQGVTTTLRRGRYLLDSECAVTFAAPQVSGVAALLFGAVPQAAALAVKQAILDGASPAPGFAGLTATGGILDAASSLRLLRARYGVCC